jgi:glycine/D-amino acid oxidase-like deaminating enzyme
VTMDAVVVGGGVLGSMHAYQARRHGYRVTQLEREAGPRGASVRNFGLIWVSGRAQGPELDLALRARSLWEEVAADVPGIGFRPHPSLTLAANDAELALLKQAVALPDARIRGYQLLDVAAARELNPGLRGEFAGALLGGMDAIVEPRNVLAAIRAHLLADGDGYTWLPGREAIEVRPGPHRRVARR